MTRKDFLKQLFIGGTTVIGSGILFSACGGSEKKTAEKDPCADLTGLTEEEKAPREDFEYVAETPIPGQRCDNCALWIEPEEGSPCGGCQIMAGPFHPGGYCTAWIAMEE